MVLDASLKNKSIALRKQGKTYSEILAHIKVAKSTLSIWLHSVGLSKKQKQRITAKRLAGVRRGGLTVHRQRLARVQAIHNEAAKDIQAISKRDLWFLGIALYWAEGTKEKEKYPGSNLTFNNSDRRMIELYVRWLCQILEIPTDRIVFTLYVHQTSSQRVPNIVQYWSNIPEIRERGISGVYFKKGNPKTNRSNVGENYFGVLRVAVSGSSRLNRTVAGWVDRIVQLCRVV